MSVNLYKCDDYSDNKVNNVITSIINDFDVLKNITSNTKVVIKANLVSAMNPDKAATTNYTLIRELTKYLLNKKCSVVVGDSPGGVFTKRYLSRFYVVTKMNETGAKLNDNFETKNTLFNDAKVLKSFEYTKYLDDADIKINFSKLKTHAMMGMSASVKNLFGNIPGTKKPEYHYRFPNHEDFANMLIDLNEYFKFDLNICDAVVGMEGNGPTMGKPRKIGLVLASKSPYELDYISAKIIGFNENDVETVKQSINRQLLNKETIKINGNINDYMIKDFDIEKQKKPLTFYTNKKDIFGKLISLGSNKIFENKPLVKKSRCIGCEKCKNTCPMKAITMVNKKPVIDRNKCIKCYCCQEFCPVGAMQVKTSFFLKILHYKKK